MKKKNKIFIISITTTLLLFFIIYFINNKTNTLKAVVVDLKENTLTVRSSENINYTFEVDNLNIKKGADIIIEYVKGLTKKNKITNYDIPQVDITSEGIEVEYLDNGIFSDYYLQANKKLNELTLDEKIGQLFLVRYTDESIMEDILTYKIGGFVFYEKDFKDKTEEEVKLMIKNLQNVTNIPLITAVDEEGGNVVRISSNSNLANEPFKSSNELYNIGGMQKIKEDTINKSKILSDLGINLNLAPVVDIAKSKEDYIYKRTLGQNSFITAKYAKTIIEASKDLNVSYTLKHFPGYGNNSDTHKISSVDDRTYEEIMNNDILPFSSGIESGCEAIMVSHNIVTSIDANNPASLSLRIHELLRNELNFTGIIITDDISMKAIKNEGEAAISTIIAGNDLIITTNYTESIKSVKDAIEKQIINEKMIDRIVFRILAWKYYKGIL